MKLLSLILLSLFTIMNIDAKSDPLVKKKSVLIFTKNGLTLEGKKGYVHENIAASIKALEEICAQENILTTVSEDASLFSDENLAQFDAIIFSNTNNEVFETEEQKLAFQNFIKNDGGFVSIHSAVATARDWPWFWALVGGKFVNHPPNQEFEVRVTDPTHASTNFLGTKWKVKDECYFVNHINPDIHVLLSADLTTVEGAHKSSYPGDVFGDLFPVCWLHEFEGSRQWHTSLGHDAEAYDDPIFRKHLRGGILWALSLKHK